MSNFAISIDTETLGLDVDAPIIQIGAAMFDTTSVDYPKCVPAVLEFYVWRESFHYVEPYAAAMNAEILYAIASVRMAKGVDVLDFSREEIKYPGIYVRYTHAISYLNEWMLQWKHCFEDDKFVFAGKNFGVFDLPKLQALPGTLAPHRHRFIDPSNLYWTPEVDGTVLPDTKTCMKRAGMEGRVSHTALADARDVAELIQRWTQVGVAENVA